MMIYALDDPRFVPMRIKPVPPRKSVSLPDHLDPAVHELLEYLIRNDIPWLRVEIDADLGASTVRRWAYREDGPSVRGPGINYVRRALRAIGKDLAVVDLEP